MSGAVHNPCATCGACCRSYIVPVCGYDVWLISTRQRLAPEQFLIACPQERLGPEAFYLDADGPPYGLMLDKQGRLRLKQSCVFLVHLVGGHDRCGIYDDRPVVCRAYPMSRWSDAVRQRKDALCPPGAWPLAELRQPAWRAALQRLQMQFDIYYAVVARWNARVSAARPGSRFAVGEYLSYLMNVYDRLAALDLEIGPEEVARVQSSWRATPLPNDDLDEIRVQVGEFPWLDHLIRVRRIVDGFYPEIPPQPLRVQLLTQRPEGDDEASPEGAGRDEVAPGRAAG